MSDLILSCVTIFGRCCDLVDLLSCDVCIGCLHMQPPSLCWSVVQRSKVTRVGLAALHPRLSGVAMSQSSNSLAA